jgi:hypothetical protein
MTTPSLSSDAFPRSTSNTSLLGIFFFVLGAPHVYGALKQKSGMVSWLRATPYALVALLGGTIAGLVEVFML